MSMSRRLLTLAGLVFLVVPPVLARAPQVITLPEPTEAEIQAQIRRLGPKNDKAVRLEAVRWFQHKYWAKKAVSALPALEECIRHDPEWEVRRDAVQAFAMISREAKKPCPPGFLEALLDKKGEVGWQALATIPLFKGFAPGAEKVLLRCVRSKDPNTRSNGLLLLARAAGKDPKVREVFEKAKKDEVFQVRCDAYWAMFRANDNLGEFLTYIIRVREEPDAVLSPAPADSPTRKQEMMCRNLFLIGSATRLSEWSERRADELASVLLELLKSRTAIIRRGAANLIGATAVKVDLEDSKWKRDVRRYRPLDDYRDAYKEFNNLPYLKKDAGPARPPEMSKVAARLLKLKVEERLCELRDHDPDRTVRAAARRALQRLAEVKKKP